ncbi:DMT family transporter [Peribacillus simplex]|uniref:DMT family transporter n=1 Tax=Peribacillus simplex TaxID=1478 RepID=UPI000F6439AA|nr:DMT family transporter [Peribacillus simplex]RRN68386.1 DMT family transporter [Peribacillus simplex]
MKSRTFVCMLALFHSCIVGLSFLFTKMAIAESNPLDTLAFRFTVSFAIILFLVAFKVIKLNYSWESAKNLVPLSLLFPTLFFAFQTFGLKYSQSTDAGILSAVTPILTLMIAGYFLKEKTSLYQKLSIVLSVVGVIFIFVMKGSTINFSDMLGMVLILLSCIATACYTTMTCSLAKDYTPGEMSFFMMGTGFVIFNVAALVSHLKQATMPEFFTPWSSMEFISSILYLGILASLVTSLLSNTILSKIKASQMSVFANLSTVVTIAAGALILDENITIYDIMGSVLIILGVIGTNYFEGEKEHTIKANLEYKEEQSVK